MESRLLYTKPEWRLCGLISLPSVEKGYYTVQEIGLSPEEASYC